MRYVAIIDSKWVKVNSVNPSYLIFSKANRNFEIINGNKYLTLVSTNESKDKIKKNEEVLSKIRDLIGAITKTQMIIIKNIWKSNLTIRI